MSHKPGMMVSLLASTNLSLRPRPTGRPTSLRLIPWRPEERNRTARMFCDVRVPGGEPYEGDPRWIMRRAGVRPPALVSLILMP